MTLKNILVGSVAACLLALLVPASSAFAHGGGLDKHGCHNNKKTGKYHCHRAQAKSRPKVSKLKGKTTDTAGNVYYQNCAAARKAGVAPIRRGEAGYGTHLDRDSDGIACE